MRIEAEIGPVVLLLERDNEPQPGDRFKVAVFVSDRALGVANVTHDQWAAFCKVATLRIGPCGDYQPDPTSETTRCKRCGTPYGAHR